MQRFYLKTILTLFLLSFFAQTSHAVWIWTPESGKFFNPKYAVKDSPREQYDYAMKFFDANDYKKAIGEFQKLIDAYTYSEYAASAQYYIGLSHEKLSNLHKAYKSYQTVIESYPYSKRNDEIIERQFNIAETYFEGAKAKVWGVAILPSADKAVEIYSKVIENAPYGKFADVSLYKIGLTYQKHKRFEEAVKSFQRIIDEYPTSALKEDARYQIAYSTYKTSIDPRYDQSSTDKAIKEFEGFVRDHDSSELTEEVQLSLNTLNQKKAEKEYSVAKFYHDRRKYKSAEIYYLKVIKEYPDTKSAEKAEAQLAKIQKKLKK